ncbi:MAG: indole-3-glycerol phosphate synthase TrpC [Actinomycetota bacterium]
MRVALTFLEQILTSRREAVERLKRSSFPVGPPIRDFRGALGAEGISLIAEIKRASPSRGDLNADLDPATLAKAYEDGGARALSILMEPEFFKGSADDLIAARGAGHQLPVLWKDFVIDSAQVDAARSAGADAVLVIVRILKDTELNDLVERVHATAMCALVEVFDERDLERALRAGATVIGVNHRDLETFEEDPTATKRLRPLVPDDVVLVAESAISSRSDVAELEAIGVDAVLVGETLVTAGDPEAKIRELLGA